jgi:hypothetical protein
MKNSVLMPLLEEKLPVFEQPDLEEGFEPRLQRLRRLVKDLAGSAYPLLVIEISRIRRGLGELVIKEEATRWILRIAKDSDDPVRRELLAHVADALNDLERMAETLLYAECT